MAKTVKAKQATLVKLPFWQDDRKMGWLFFGFAFLLYAQTIGFDYALDDVAVISRNEFVQDGFGGIGKLLSTFYWAGFPDYATQNSGIFRPVSMIMFAVEWQLFHGSTPFFHFVNVLLYALVAYQLYRLLRQLFHKQGIMLSIIACGIWITLPVHVEVVANIKSGDELLSMLFFLLSFRKLLDWSETHELKSLVFASLWIFLSLLSKEGAALFIPVMFFGLILFREKKIKQLIQPVVFFAVIGLVWLGWHTAVISSGPEKITYDYRHNTLYSSTSEIDRIGTAIGMQARYWVKMLVGYPLSYDYSFNEIPVDGFSSAWAILSLAGIAAAVFICIKFFRTLPVLVFGILFYFITFALTSNIFYLIGATFAERFAFAPSIGFAIIIAWLILKLTKGLAERKIHASAMYILLPLMLVYSIRSFARSQTWKSDTDLYVTDSEHAPGSARVHYNYGVKLIDYALGAPDEIKRKEYYDQAYEEFITAVTIDSNDVQSCFNLGVVEYRRGNYAASVKWSREVLRINPNDVSVFGNLGDALRSLGKTDSAIVCYRAAIEKKAATTDTWMNMGYAYLIRRDTVAALDAFDGATKLNPKYAIAYDKIANVAGMHREYERSVKAALVLAQLNPNDPNPYSMLRTSYLLMGDTAMAVKYYQEYVKRGGK
ncbi:MAG: tetratricopeptide repeat protein [Bacteroidota bacterium]|nr:tetratricopeptide repeat protein [Bacteroidota bacterium]